MPKYKLSPENRALEQERKEKFAQYHERTGCKNF